MDYTFITGATGGLGKAFCYECAKNGENLFLTGRSKEKLEALRTDILKLHSNVSIQFFPCTLNDEVDRGKLFSHIVSLNLSFNKLINVAGVDVQKSFKEYSQEKLIFQTRVNFEAGVTVTRFVLDHASANLKIISVSSVSGIYPMPYFAVYSALKCATTYFYSALREEVKKDGICVTTVLPGAMPTREDIKEQIKGQGLWGKLAACSPEYVAKRSLRAVEKNKRTYIPGFWNKAMNICTKIIPLPLKMKFIAKRWSKISKDAF